MYPFRPIARGVNPAAMIETEIEVFRAGTPAARGITAEQLAEVATYECGDKPVPLCFGHPTSDTPAAGGIGGFRAEGNRLFAKVATLTEKAIEGIKSGEWLDRSMAFFHPDHEANPRPGKWSPRHVGLLGGAAPGIPGMASLRTELGSRLAYTADGGLVADGAPADAIVYATEQPTTTHTVFEAKEPTNMTDQTTDQAAEFAAREERLAERERAAAARIRTQFEAGNNAAIDNLVREGKVLPAEAADLKTAFNALDPEADELTFGAGDKTSKATAASKLLTFIAGLDKRVPLGDRSSPEGEATDTGNKPKTGAEFVAAANALAKEKGLTFDAACAELAG